MNKRFVFCIMLLILVFTLFVGLKEIFKGHDFKTESGIEIYN